LLAASEKDKSFIIIRLSSLGDILLTTPALRCLHKTYPSARIDYLVKERYAELLTGNPHLTSVIPFPEPADYDALSKIVTRLKGNYSTVIDLHTSLRSYQIRKRLDADQVYHYKKRRFKRWILVNCKRDYYPADFSIPSAYIDAMAPLGVEDDGEGMEWQNAYGCRGQFLQKAMLDTEPEIQPIALCPGASFATKRWVQKRWVELAEKLLKGDAPIWVFGDDSDRETGEMIVKIDPERVVNFCGSLSIPESGAGLSFCRYAVTHDAGPLHMAAAVNTPVLAIFGSTVPRFGFAPFRIPHRIAEIDLSCRPCSHLGFNECPKEHFRCMKDLSVERVLELVKELEGEIEE